MTIDQLKVAADAIDPTQPFAVESFMATVYQCAADNNYCIDESDPDDPFLVAICGAWGIAKPSGAGPQPFPDPAWPNGWLDWLWARVKDLPILIVGPG